MRETQNTSLKLNTDKAKIKRANSRGARKKKRATNFMGAEGKALHKPGVCEKAKHAKHKLLTTKSVQKTTGAEGKALKLYGGPREEHCTNYR